MFENMAGVGVGRSWSGKGDYESDPNNTDNRQLARTGDTEVRRGFEMAQMPDYNIKM